MGILSDEFNDAEKVSECLSIIATQKKDFGSEAHPWIRRMGDGDF